MKLIKIAGIPEHFCAPWKYAVTNNLFSSVDLDVKFIEYGTGTGAICHDLSEGKVDMAIVLTEGIINYQHKDPSLKIISQFVDTPLKWGIYVNKISSMQALDDLAHATFGISRFGSGSHLMTQVLAKQNHWNFSEINFIEIGAIAALAESITKNKIDAFLWEILTTSPFLQSHQLRLFDTITTPWPCFQWVTTKDFSSENEIIEKIASVIFSVNREFNANKNFAATVIENFYHFSKPDILTWLNTVKWTEQISFDPQIISLIETYLSDV